MYDSKITHKHFPHDLLIIYHFVFEIIISNNCVFRYKNDVRIRTIIEELY